MMGPDTPYNFDPVQNMGEMLGIPKKFVEPAPMSGLNPPTLYSFSGGAQEWQRYTAFVAFWATANIPYMPGWLGSSRRAVASRLAQAYWDFNEAMDKIGR